MLMVSVNVSEQCGIAASKGNQILGLIRRNVTYKNKQPIVLMYKTIWNIAIIHGDHIVRRKHTTIGNKEYNKEQQSLFLSCAVIKAAQYNVI